MIAADLATAAPELFLACAASLLLMIGVYRGQDSATRLMLYASVLVLLIALVILVAGPREGSQTAFSGLFIADGFGDFMKLLVLLGAW